MKFNFGPFCFSFKRLYSQIALKREISFYFYSLFSYSVFHCLAEKSPRGDCKAGTIEDSMHESFLSIAMEVQYNQQFIHFCKNEIMFNGAKFKMEVDLKE